MRKNAETEDEKPLKRNVFGVQMGLSMSKLVFEAIRSKIMADEDEFTRLSNSCWDFMFKQEADDNENSNRDQQAPARRGQLAREEERQGIIQFRAVTNDGSSESMILLTGLKNIYQKQLPKMPREYIARLVYDRNHASMAIVKKNMNVVGGITYRAFETQKFAEIVFCAITSTEQVKGYGSHLMNHLKSYVRRTTNVEHFLTYADNYAIGYFKKQGFTADVTLDRSVWAGYIKDYEGGTIMHCQMVPRIEYLEVNDIIEQQKKAIFDHIQALNRDPATMYPGIDFDEIKKREGRMVLEPHEIPGLLESGWNPGMEKEAEEADPLYPLLRQLLNDLTDQTWAWPFAEPVDPETVPGYYAVIKEPMDLKTMDHRLEHGFYKSLDMFVKDFDRIISNCKMFNDSKSVYVKCAIKLDQIFKNRLKAAKEVAEGRQQ